MSKNNLARPLPDLYDELDRVVERSSAPMPIATIAKPGFRARTSTLSPSSAGPASSTRRGTAGSASITSAFGEAAYRIGQADASTGLVYVMHVGAAQTINLFGNDDQKERWLKPNGRHLLGTYSTSERASGGHWWYNFSEAAPRRRGLSRQRREVVHDQFRAGRLLRHADPQPGAKDQTDISSSSSTARRPASSQGLGTRSVCGPTTPVRSATRA